jgi:hypothetical protein
MMSGRKNFRACAAIAAAVVSLYVANAQSPPPNPPPGAPATPVPGALLTPQQLDNLVAPVALYPDPLLGEVLAACTYPFEIAEAQQWVLDHAKWKPSKLMDEAKKQNWDPSVQGLVAFPQVLARLSQGMSWVTQLGNAFLAQQADVMQAVQRMRAQAQARGTLRSTPQEVVTTQTQNGQSAINIQPASPDTWYVPDYNPVYVWGPPVYGVYPPLIYPGIDVGFVWGVGIDLPLFFGGWGGWGWGGWGWSLNWFGGGIYLNHSFFHRYGFSHFHGEPLGVSAWAHDPAHRLGVPYGNPSVAARFARPGGFALSGREVGGGFAGSGLGAREGFNAPRVGSPGFEQRSWTGNHSVFGGYHSGGMTRMQSDHGFGSMGAGRTSGGGFGGVRGGGGGRR